MDGLQLQRVGPVNGGSGTGTPFRADGTGAQIVSDAHGRYAEAARRKQVFYACNAAAQAVSVALATAYTGVCLSNPIGSSVNLELLQVSFALSVAPAAIAPLILIGGYSPIDVTHTAALIPASTFLGAPGGVGKADSQATISTPKYLLPIMGGFTAGALPDASPAILDVGGSIIIPPGAFVCIGALTAVTGFGAMLWEEVPIIAGN